MVTAIITSCGRSTLERAIQSVLNNGKLVTELVVVFTKPNLKVPDLLYRLNVTPITIDTNIIGIARDYGVYTSKNNIIAFLDDDDYWLDDHINQCFNSFKSLSCDYTATGFYKLECDKICEEKLSPASIIIEELLRRNIGIRASNLVIKKEVYQNVNGFSNLLFTQNDIDLIIRLHQKGFSYAQTNCRQVVFDNTNYLNRLSTPGTSIKSHSLFIFLWKYGHLFDKSTRHKYILKSKNLWNIDLTFIEHEDADWINSRLQKYSKQNEKKNDTFLINELTKEFTWSEKRSLFQNHFKSNMKFRLNRISPRLGNVS